MNSRTSVFLCLFAFAFGFSEIQQPATGAESEAAPEGAEDFEKLHALIKPQPGESRWMEIDWHPTVQEGWKKAAAEGKPIFFMAGSGGAPSAGC